MVTQQAMMNVPATVLMGAGSRHRLAEQVRRLGGSRVLLVTDAFMRSCGVADELINALAAGGITTTVFDGVQADPTAANVDEGLQRLRAIDADLIVALGGGSPMDCAKAISIMTTNASPLSQYMGYHKIPRAGIPLIAIPTTAGTGSEVTKVTVITDTERNVKMMLLDAHLLPTVAIVDYELTMSMPKPLTAHVGVDTLTHAIEAYVSKKANPMTDPIALSCIDLCARYLRKAWADPDHREARAAMSAAACQGGMAFANSSVCLVHGMSRPIGALFHIPHGKSNAMLLPAVTRFSVSGAPQRYARIAVTMGLADENDSAERACDALIAGLETLNADLEVPRLRDCEGVNRESLGRVVEKMAHDALASGSPDNNPRVPSVEEIVALYYEAW